jgi:transmembrane sensor
MDDLAREIAAIREDLTPEWDDARNERLFHGVGRLQRRQRRQKVIGSAVVISVAALAIGVGLQSVPVREHAGALAGRNVPHEAQVESAPPATRAAVVTHVKARQRVHLADGSTAVVVSNAGGLDVLRNQPEHLELTLQAGTAHFEVVPNKRRQFLVNAGRVQVAVVGTVFDVEHANERVRVQVNEGKVRIETPTGTQFVSAGESAWFDAHGARLRAAEALAAEPQAAEAVRALDQFQEGAARADKSALPAARDAVVKSKRVAAKEEKTSAAKVSWRSLCQSGDYEEAYRVLESGVEVEDEPAALMDAADAARLSNHPQASVTYLRRVLRDHKRSPVAPLAGFTLGRVLLETLGQPSEAAEAFALARSIAPDGSLAQDALAREVEAWSKAGKSHEAYQRAQLYVQQYPTGRRLRAVRLHGGLD